MESMYFVAVVLPGHLDEKILRHKKWMREKYGCRVGLKSPAHLTLVPPFWTNVENESQLKTGLEKIAATVLPFTIVTRNFSAFPPRTLFVAVGENGALAALKRISDEQFGSAEYNIKIDKRPFHPHITVATRDLHKKDFAEAWPHFEKIKFEEEFEAGGLSLLKHNGARWEVILTARFNG